MGLFTKKPELVTVKGEDNTYAKIVKGEFEAIAPGLIKSVEAVKTNRNDVASVRVVTMKGEEKFVTFAIYKDDTRTVLEMGEACNAVKDLIS